MYLALPFFSENVYELYKNMAQWEKKAIEYKVSWLFFKHRATIRTRLDCMIWFS